MIPTTNFTTKVAKLLDHFVHVGKRVIALSIKEEEKAKKENKNAQFVLEIREESIDSLILWHVSEDKKEPVLLKARGDAALDHPTFSRCRGPMDIIRAAEKKENKSSRGGEYLEFEKENSTS